jgi:hypothetical protein
MQRVEKGINFNMTDDAGLFVSVASLKPVYRLLLFTQAKIDCSARS